MALWGGNFAEKVRMSSSHHEDSGEATRLIVCEKSGHWAQRLRRNLPDGVRWIVETRSVSQLLESLKEHPTPLVLLELTPANIQYAARAVDELYRQYPHGTLVAILPTVAEKSFAGSEQLAWLLRELGAASVIRSPRAVPEIARLWAQHCRLHPPYEETFCGRVFNNLPWAAA